MKVNSENNIPVTKPYLPSINHLKEELEKIWKSGILTNNGPLLKLLEEKLRIHLGVHHLQIHANGTLSLQLAIRALGIKGKVLTTPYSYVATTSSILWENCEPVFIDISEDGFNVNPELIRKAVTENEISGMLFTHVYGIPCDVESIQKISEEFSIPVIYDAAHAFGVEYKGQSVLNYGDISTLSFHATKIFHMVEGGAVVFKNTDLEEKLFLMRSFGHRADDHFQLGINAKNSELHSMIGLAVLDEISTILKKREMQWRLYFDALHGKQGLRIMTLNSDVKYNFSYFPLVFESSVKFLAVLDFLKSKNIFPRRYFFPSLNRLPYVRMVDCPISESITSRVMCLPLYHDLQEHDQKRIIDLILNYQ